MPSENKNILLEIMKMKHMYIEETLKQNKIIYF